MLPIELPTKLWRSKAAIKMRWGSRQGEKSTDRIGGRKPVPYRHGRDKGENVNKYWETKTKYIIWGTKDTCKSSRHNSRHRCLCFIMYKKHSRKLISISYSQIFKDLEHGLSSTRWLTAFNSIIFQIDRQM